MRISDWSSDVCSSDLHAARALRLAAAPIEKMPGRKATFQAIPNPEEFDAALDELLSVLDHSIKLLSVVSEKHPDLAATAKTCLDIRAKLYQWTQPDRQGNNALKPTGVDADSGGQIGRASRRERVWQCV